MSDRATGATFAAAGVACAAGAVAGTFLSAEAPFNRLIPGAPLLALAGAVPALIGAALLAIAHGLFRRRGVTDPGSYLIAGLVIAAPFAIILAKGPLAGLADPGPWWAPLIGGAMGALAFWWVRRPDEA